MTAASALAIGGTATVLDVDGGYAPTGGETVLRPADLCLPIEAVHRRALTLGAEGLCRWLYPAALRHVGGNEPVLALHAGMVLLRWPASLIDIATGGLGLVSRTAALRGDGLWPDWREAERYGTYLPGIITVRPDASEVLDLWTELTDHPASPHDRWLDIAASRHPHIVTRDATTVLSTWTLTPEHAVRATDSGLDVDGVPVAAVDLANLDPQRVWLLDATTPREPRARLSDHPTFARWVADRGEELRSRSQSLPRPDWDLSVTSLDVRVHDHLRAVYQQAVEAATQGRADDPPDPFDPTRRAEFEDWLLEPSGDRPGRYLLAIQRSRSDLQNLFPGVPGEHTTGFLDWCRHHGRYEPTYNTELVDSALDRVTHLSQPIHRSQTEPGVTVVGFLGGELGIGESARLMISALEAAEVPHSSVAVDSGLLSPRRELLLPTQPVPRDTVLLCVNADHMRPVTAAVPSLLERSHRIGMWYWEVESFPTEQHEGFAHVDEVWAATDFVRDAIARHSPVPVHTVTPPLPQRGPDPVLKRSDLGLPENRPVLLFSFDYLSTAERKNPYGLVETFNRAFRPDEGPVLVLKSINAGQRPAESERLRLLVDGHPDIMLFEGYLSPAERDALVALSDCYVSLHRSEGLGLTMAEAMAWGKPVIATSYSGNMQFMTEENSFLVPWRPCPIPEDAAPYPAGTTWADPDLDAAAALMRAVVEDPRMAAQRGTRAAHDLATHHTPAAAGRVIAERLDQALHRRRQRSQVLSREWIRHAMGRGHT